MASWRDNVDPMIKSHLETQIKEATKFSSYKQSRNPGNAQLWIAVANLSKQLFDLNLKLNYLERALQDIGGRKKKEEEIKNISKVKVKTKRRK